MRERTDGRYQLTSNLKHKDIASDNNKMKSTHFTLSRQKNASCRATGDKILHKQVAVVAELNPARALLLLLLLLLLKDVCGSTINHDLTTLKVLNEITDLVRTLQS